MALCAAALAIGLVLAAVSRVNAADVPGFVAGATAPTSPVGSAPTEQVAATAEPARAPATATARPTTAPTPPPSGPPATPAATSAPPAPTPAPAYVEYTVRKGDILYTIAARYGLKVEDILAINQIAKPESLTVGQVIRIPSRK